MIQVDGPAHLNDLKQQFRRLEWSCLPGGFDAEGLLGAALAAAEAVLEVYDRSSAPAVSWKEDASPVTDADRVSQKILLEFLSRSSFVVLSEEAPEAHLSGLAALQRGAGVICVDPLDGTKEFIKKNGQFSINVGVVCGGLPVFGLVLAPVSGVWQMGRVDPDSRRGYFLSGEPLSPSSNAGWRLRSTVHSLDPLPIEHLRASVLQQEIKDPQEPFVAYLSGSHVARESERLASVGLPCEVRRLGSALKFCRLTSDQDECGDVYLRLTPTCLWDTAAGHALLLATGGYMVPLKGDLQAFRYDGHSLVNSGFLAWRAGFSVEKVGQIFSVFSQE
jgi:3'(2'), 5'-bisphosphate nucleotidase